MKRFAIFAVSMIAAAGMVFAQTEVGATDPAAVGPVVAQQELVEVSVDRFEAEGGWESSIARDVGVISSRLFNGGPEAKQPIPAEQGMDIRDQTVLGVRVDFTRRGHHSFFVRAVRPIPIEGVTRTVSVWVAGRNANHRLSLMVRDMYGRQHTIRMGTLNFQGWQQMTATIPPQPIVGTNGVMQRNTRNSNQRMGLEIIGFRVDTDPVESFGSYFVYFDDLRAVTDLFALSRDPDDMVDNW